MPLSCKLISFSAINNRIYNMTTYYLENISPPGLFEQKKYKLLTKSIKETINIDANAKLSATIKPREN